MACSAQFLSDYFFSYSRCSDNAAMYNRLELTVGRVADVGAMKIEFEAGGALPQLLLAARPCRNSNRSKMQEQIG